MAKSLSASNPEDMRAQFVSQQAFSLDPFQVEALDVLDSGSSVVVAAPTGSGKTVVAEYAINLAVVEGTKAFYTTPLKALSNQKYHDLVERWGSERVGLLTGDNSVNGDAPIVVMTTEVLRNMIYAKSPTLENLSFVILDEVHYLQNAYRGPVWEEVIIHAPPSVRLVCLSATVSNADNLSEWIGTVRGETKAVVEDKRPIVLENFYAVGDRYADMPNMVPMFKNRVPNPEAAELDASKMRFTHRRGRPKSRLHTPFREEMIDLLDTRTMLPAIYFIFSRAACEDAVRQCVSAGVRLTSADDRKQIREIAEQMTSHIADEDLDALRYNEWLVGLEAGVAAHHAGLVPPFKQVVEECFSRALIKVVFATETLALGINMPARTVVIEKLTKFTGERHEFLTAGEFTQLTGRAGRRGIDNVGYAVVLWSPFIPFDQVAALASAKSFELTSSFRPTYNMAANLIRNYDPAQARHLLNLSFAQFRTDAEIVRLEQKLERLKNEVIASIEMSTCELGSVEDYVALKRKPSEEIADIDHDEVVKGVERLAPGDIIAPPGKSVSTRMLVISVANRRGGDIRVRVLNTERRLVHYSIQDFREVPKVIGHVELPSPFAPNNAFFRRRSAQLLMSASVTSTKISQADKKKRREETRNHPVASCPDAEEHVKAFKAKQKAEKEVDRLTGLIKGRSESLARQFDRVLRVLEDREYVNEWSLTELGEKLTHTYHESDLLLVEVLRLGVLDGLTPPELALLVSTITYETRGIDAPVGWYNSGETKRRYDEMVEIAVELNRDEAEAGLPATRVPDPGFTSYAYAWASGEDLAEILAENEMSGGDFVRNVKQLIDVLRQIDSVSINHETRQCARVAADGLLRDVVLTSSAIEDEE